MLGELRVPSTSLRPAPSMLRPDGERSSGAENVFSGVSRISRDRADAEMVFVINLDVLLRGGQTPGGGR